MMRSRTTFDSAIIFLKNQRLVRHLRTNGSRRVASVLPEPQMWPVSPGTSHISSFKGLVTADGGECDPGNWLSQDPLDPVPKRHPPLFCALASLGLPDSVAQESVWRGSRWPPLVSQAGLQLLPALMPDRAPFRSTGSLATSLPHTQLWLLQAWPPTGKEQVWLSLLLGTPVRPHPKPCSLHGESKPQRNEICVLERRVKGGPSDQAGH